MTWPSGSDQSNKNEGAPDSLESWDAQLNSPPPKSAHNYLTIRPASWEWPRWATVKKSPAERKVATWQRRPHFVASYSCSLRIFFRARLRAKASFTRRFSPGFK
jgi:hypothetical protein